MIMLRIKAFYHLRKPRVLAPRDISFLTYQKKMRETRKRIHLEAIEYLQQIEDKYLEDHKDAMRKLHFQNECAFRRQIFTDAWRLQQNMAQWKKRDEQFDARLNKHLHDEDVRKINRSRILKIMEHESSHYWFNSENASVRLNQETIFPEYVASSEYYYKLFAEALAYEIGDLYQVHQLTSNQQIIREKNKYMIPLYLSLRGKIAEFKRDHDKQLQQAHLIKLDHIRANKDLSQERIRQLEERENEEYQQKKKEIEQNKNDEGFRLNELKTKIQNLLSIFKTWKEYTNILGMTSAQIIKNQLQVDIQPQIYKAEKQYLKNLKSRKAETFVDSIEQDTQQVQITFEEYLNKINQQRKEQTISAEQSAGVQQLDSLFSSIQDELQSGEKKTDSIQLNLNDKLDLSKLVGEKPVSTTESKSSYINPEFLNPKETTTSVQVLKEQFKNNSEILLLLNKLGEIDVRYPKLFQKIWESVESK